VKDIEIICLDGSLIRLMKKDKMEIRKRQIQRINLFCTKVDYCESKTACKRFEWFFNNIMI